MKKAMWVILAFAVLAVTGCAQKSESEKMMDQMKKDANKAADQMKKEINNL
jgi:outer membrane lipoprotein-sorting protein